MSDSTCAECGELATHRVLVPFVRYSPSGKLLAHGETWEELCSRHLPDEDWTREELGERRATSALLTGSRAYGTPRDDSDWDLVVRVDQATSDLLVRELPCKHASVSGSVKIGNLNLIFATSDEAFDVWREGTEALQARRPVTRPEAIETFRLLRVAPSRAR